MAALPQEVRAATDADAGMTAAWQMAPVFHCKGPQCGELVNFCVQTGPQARVAGHAAALRACQAQCSLLRSMRTRAP